LSLVAVHSVSLKDIISKVTCYVSVEHEIDHSFSLDMFWRMPWYCNLSAWGLTKWNLLHVKPLRIFRQQDHVVQSYKFSRVNEFTVGHIFHFPIDFCVGLTTLGAKCTACDKSIGGLFW